MNKRERDLMRDMVTIADMYECAVTLARRTGKNHPVFRFRSRKTGNTRSYVTASTSTSNSGRLNCLAACKRICKQISVDVDRERAINHKIDEANS